MADVYKFSVRLKNLEEIIWRELEITSVSSVAKLGYTVIAAFEATASHLFCIGYNGERYEIEFEDMGFKEPAIDPIKAKLSALKLMVGDILKMRYDYGAGWEFSIELISIIEMKRGTGTHYPYVTDGKGKGIIENVFSHELLEIIEQINSTGNIPKVYDAFKGKEVEWDYREFDIGYLNIFLKDYVARIREAYEMFE
ncbi:MAG TPA: plasmid pRiA4b ORF-3 family protein [Epulopiscium sp.]|nr:plasmid pRiA4b ORF-3 family protein [Candidatus Epulonipiscium sp.]